MRSLEFREGDDPQMARLDPGASRLKYRIERLMLTPFFRFSLRVLLPFALCLGAGAAWFSVEENREDFNLMISEVRAAVENRPEFQVRMMVVDGADEALIDMIRAELPIDFPISSFDMDLDRLQRRVVALDEVKSAELRVRQGGVLQVDVVQRQPVVLWRTSAGVDLLDEGGIFVAQAEHRADFADLPVIAGDILRPEAAAALKKPAADRSEAEAKLAEAAQARMALVVEEALRMDALTGPIRDRLRGFERIGARRWDVVLDRGQRIMLPEQGAERVLEQVIAMAVTEGVDLLARDLVAVDLRLPRRPTIRMTDAATQEMRRIKAIEAGREVKQ
ncbi:cell division protein FtsQ [Mameliella alba]|uniref:cell division protein FtsQ/DivIB n=1 Tax=Mameliella TaxID=1434019 RepID=UPI00087FBBDD|nr:MULTISPECIES: cell division protein FtsQ/DivIB [Mameliella]MBV6638012.1 cell division protein FtsQ/DivIB [Mameliella sp.]MCR9273464.1 cell division protein FtsQ/DivIB [Paracoccaceae bacterium]OWV48088.1 cell division protein FtsQ [Mameliella alba]OWV54942.1 cell division protein FtsQ [Mameliella alba]PTR40116.1 cell division protein FtsQ [Mameliella alba]